MVEKVEKRWPKELFTSKLERHKKKAREFYDTVISHFHKKGKHLEGAKYLINILSPRAALKLLFKGGKYDEGVKLLAKNHFKSEATLLSILGFLAKNNLFEEKHLTDEFLSEPKRYLSGILSKNQEFLQKPEVKQAALEHVQKFLETREKIKHFDFDHDLLLAFFHSAGLHKEGGELLENNGYLLQAAKLYEAGGFPFDKDAERAYSKAADYFKKKFGYVPNYSKTDYFKQARANKKRFFRKQRGND